MTTLTRTLHGLGLRARERWSLLVLLATWLVLAWKTAGWWGLDHEAITADNLAALSGGEQRILRIVASLASGSPVNLSAYLPGLDRDLMELVLAAMAHANGSHEHPDLHLDPDRRIAVLTGRLPSLHPWPEPAEGEPDDRAVPSRPAPAARPAADPRGPARRDRTATPRRGPAF